MRMILVGAAVFFLLLCSGCKTEDVLSYVGGANAYIGDVGLQMQSRGWSDFPTNALDWYRYSMDLRASVAAAKHPSVVVASLSDMGAMAAIPLKTNENPPVGSLSDAFHHSGSW